MITVEQLIEDARSWIGVPFHHQGRSRLGIDCIGLPEVILRERGVLPEGFEVDLTYGRMPQAALVEGLTRWCTEVDVPIRGGLVAIQWPRTVAVSHVAIFTGSTLIHALGRGGIGVCEHAYRGHWLKLSRSFWKLPGVAYVES